MDTIHYLHSLQPPTQSSTAGIAEPSHQPRWRSIDRTRALAAWVHVGEHRSARGISGCEGPQLKDDASTDPLVSVWFEHGLGQGVGVVSLCTRTVSESTKGAIFCPHGAARCPFQRPPTRSSPPRRPPAGRPCCPAFAGGAACDRGACDCGSAPGASRRRGLLPGATWVTACPFATLSRCMCVHGGSSPRERAPIHRARGPGSVDRRSRAGLWGRPAFRHLSGFW